MTNIIIGGAWPYANGSLHIGHIAALLPGDVIARYFRQKGENVFYVSGSDCHGTPITQRAKKENKTPQEISEYYHEEFCYVFEKLGFSYDKYIKTTDNEHKKFVSEFHKQLYTTNHVDERNDKQAYCPRCEKNLTDRLIIGNCPKCNSFTKGDQCDFCGEIIESENIKNAVCSECKTSILFNDSKQLFLKITDFEDDLRDLLNSHPYWRKNAIAFTKKYIDEGLRDRAITRNLEWGIDVPHNGYENKKIYIWAENVLGYLTCINLLCKEKNLDFYDVFCENSIHYYIHGKDNIPFHTIILPSLLLAHEKYRHLPDNIISCEYLTIDGKKISTSNNHAVWAKDLVDLYLLDTIRYFFIANAPEKRDADFSFKELKKQNNTELVGAWGNFVNRTLIFVVKYFDCKIGHFTVDKNLRTRIINLYFIIGEKIEQGKLKDALNIIFEEIRYANYYYDYQKPWITRIENEEKCEESIFQCLYLLINISNVLQPFLPFSSERISKWLNFEFEWSERNLNISEITNDITLLFNKID